ncbi:hypothetical protein WJX73_007961 [Symbiochloris irregularis]|uniref:Uncharacterized protein n=1 Tax=Symbiochloris irregularis TaxID=706552 RepID=A0AAW1NT99_9CHLO
MAGSTDVDAIWHKLKLDNRVKSRPSAAPHEAKCSALSTAPPVSAATPLCQAVVHTGTASSFEGSVSRLASDRLSVRRQALQDLQALVTSRLGESTLTPAEANKLGQATAPLLADAVASCREGAANLLIITVQASPSCTAKLLPYILPTMHSKLCTSSSEEAHEQSEEVRAALIKLLISIIQTHPQGIFDEGDKVLGMLASSARDACADVNVLGCEALCLLATVHGPALAVVSKQLVACAMPLLAHRLQKVRLVAVRAVQLLVPWGAHELILTLTGFQDPNNVPLEEFYGPSVTVNFFAKLACDSSIKVRAAFLALVGWWMTHLDSRQEHEGRLLPYLLAALSDSCPAISNAAWSILQQVGGVYERDHESEVQDMVDYAPAPDAQTTQALQWLYKGAGRKLLPACVRERAGLGVRLLTQRCLGLLAGALAAEMTGWKEQEADRAVAMLRSCIILAEDALADHLGTLLPAMCKVIENPQSGESIAGSMEIMASFMQPQQQLQWLLPMLTKPGGASEARIPVLHLLTCALEGSGMTN